MGLTDIFTRRKSAAVSAAVMYRGGQPAPISRDPKRLAAEGYQRNADVYAVVNAITTAFKGLPWVLYRVDRKAAAKNVTPTTIRRALAPMTVEQRKAYLGGLRDRGVLVPVEVHPFLDLWAQPNPHQDGASFREAAAGFYLISGNSYTHEVTPADTTKPPVELWNLRPDRTKIIVGDTENLIARYEYGEGGEPVKIDPTLVVHWKRFHPLDDFYGLSPLSAIAGAVEQSNRAEEWNTGLLKSGGMPPGAFAVDGNLTPEQRKDLNKWIDEEVAGPKNALRPLLMEGGLRWEQMGLTPLEMQFERGQILNRTKVCMAYGVAPEIVGDASNKTYSNYQEARKALYVDTVLPHAAGYAALVNGRILPRYGEDLLLEVDLDHVSALSEDRERVWDRVSGAAWLTTNEKREATGYEPVVGGDVILVPLTQVPLGSPPRDPAPLPDADPPVDPTDPDAAKRAPGTSKAFGLDADQAFAYAKGLVTKREGLTPHVRRMVEDEFLAEAQAVTTAIREGGNELTAMIRADRAMDTHRDEWLAMYRKAYLQVGLVFAEDVTGHLRKQAPVPATTKAVEDVWASHILGYLSKSAAERVTNVQDTTKDQIRAALAEGHAAGESVDELAARIDDLYLDAVIPYRSEVIARTEVLTASMSGSRAGALATGLPLDHEWVSTSDDRTRSSHADPSVNGQRVDLASPFQVNGSRLMFPGDASLGAKAGEIIQCRCAEVYHVRKVNT